MEPAYVVWAEVAKIIDAGRLAGKPKKDVTREALTRIARIPDEAARNWACDQMVRLLMDLWPREAVDEEVAQEVDAMYADSADTIRLRCYGCSKVVSTPVQKETVVRAMLMCPECLEKCWALDEDAAEPM